MCYIKISTKSYSTQQVESFMKKETTIQGNNKRKITVFSTTKPSGNLYPENHAGTQERAT